MSFGVEIQVLLQGALLVCYVLGGCPAPNSAPSSYVSVIPLWVKPTHQPEDQPPLAQPCFPALGAAPCVLGQDTGLGEVK